MEGHGRPGKVMEAGLHLVHVADRASPAVAVQLGVVDGAHVPAGRLAHLHVRMHALRGKVPERVLGVGLRHGVAARFEPLRQLQLDVRLEEMRHVHEPLGALVQRWEWRLFAVGSQQRAALHHLFAELAIKRNL